MPSPKESVKNDSRVAAQILNYVSSQRGCILKKSCEPVTATLSAAGESLDIPLSEH